MSTLKALPRKKIRDQAAEQIKEIITSEQLSPGDRLPNESELAESFGISRLSVREATKALEYLGIVETKTGVGLSVGHIDLERVTEHLGFHPALHRADPLQLIDTRIIIETGVLPHVATRMKHDRSLYDTLNAMNAELRQARSLSRWMELDIAFHRELISASGLSALMAFTDVLAVFFRRFRESVRKAEWSGGIESHQRVIDALKAGRVEDADRELRTHIESHKERI